MCALRYNGDLVWSFTKESGTLPECGTECCARCVASRAASECPRGYVVVCIEVGVGRASYSEVAFAELCARSVKVVEEQVAPMLQRVHEQCCKGDNEAEMSRQKKSSAWRLFSMLAGGMHSGVGPCGCSFSAVCAVCSALLFRERRFIVKLRFCGVDPYGPGHWFGGVTDVLGASSGEVTNYSAWGTCDFAARGLVVAEHVETQADINY